MMKLFFNVSPGCLMFDLCLDVKVLDKHQHCVPRAAAIVESRKVGVSETGGFLPIWGQIVLLVTLRAS